MGQGQYRLRQAWRNPTIVGRKLHLSVDPASHEIITHELTDDNTSDAAMISGLVANSGGNIRTVFADGAYDGAPVYQAIRDARPSRSPPKIVIPPGKASIPAKGEAHGGGERERHAAEIAVRGRMAWQRRHRYGKRSLVETAISRYPSGSTAGGSPHEPTALSRTKSPFTIQDRLPQHGPRAAGIRPSRLISQQRRRSRRPYPCTNAVRQRIKRMTIANRRLQHRLRAA
jgi:hypothetical protein